MYEILEGHGVVPVIKFNDPSEALPLADALAKGGIRIMEITFRSDAAEEAIRLVSEERPDILVGAGTVTNVDELRRAAKAGAKFIVSPGFSEEVVREGLDLDLIMLPGVITPSEVMAAKNLGLKVLKYFPASAFNAMATIKSYASVFADIKFMPTGGVNQDNMKDFLAMKNIFAIGGSWMVSGNLIKEQNWDEITRLSQEATDAYHEVRG